MSTTAQVRDAETRRVGRLLHYVALLVTFCITTACYLWIYAPLSARAEDARNETFGIDQRMANSVSIHREHQQLVRQLKVTQQRIDVVRKRIPQADQLAQFVSDVYSLAEEEGVVIDEFIQSQAVERDNYSTREVEFVGSGSYQEICHMVEAVRTLQRLTRVSSLSISNTKQSGTSFPLRMRVTIFFDLEVSSGGETEASNG